jgi:excinuclease ABC subunit B
MAEFKVHSDYEPSGDQPTAIKELVGGLKSGSDYQTLLGVTGSGKTFTIAKVIEEVQKPTLIISHNKTLAAQLFGEFKTLFPNNAVEYFISYYDYYQPEAYLPVTDTFIEKDFSMNDEIDKLRLKATSSLIERKDVIVVSSVSCIYGIGSPSDYENNVIKIKNGDSIQRRKLLTQLINIYYVRNDMVLERGNFRVRGDVIELFPAYTDYCIRIELFGSNIESISSFDHITGEIVNEMESVAIFPAKHFVTERDSVLKAIKEIRLELTARVTELQSLGKLLEAQRIEQRTNFDLEMMKEVGYCSGIENYSRFFGDRKRKEVLVDYGFRLPSALDNRPLKIDEFLPMQNQIIFASATPADQELELSNGVIVEQIIRPTGLIDPEVEVRETEGQIDDLIGEIRKRVTKNERTLITTLTKRMSEDLTEYLRGLSLRVKYLHSEVKSVERVKILRDLRLGEFDVLVGINLGFLRSKSALMQVAGRAARNLSGRVILYGDKVTDAMQHLIDETARRRIIQREYNKLNNITPKTIYKSNEDVMKATSVANSYRTEEFEYKSKRRGSDFDLLDKQAALEMMRKEMLEAAENLEFEQAASLRDEISKLEKEVGTKF